jgi:hypothetical protein
MMLGVLVGGVDEDIGVDVTVPASFTLSGSTRTTS